MKAAAFRWDSSMFDEHGKACLSLAACEVIFGIT